MKKRDWIWIEIPYIAQGEKLEAKTLCAKLKEGSGGTLGNTVMNSYLLVLRPACLFCHVVSYWEADFYIRFKLFLVSFWLQKHCRLL